MTVHKFKSLGVALVLALVLQGCATETILHKSELQNISQLTLARESSPTMKKFSGGGVGGGIVLGAVLGLGGIMLAMDAVAMGEGKATTERLGLPDFGQLVMEQFARQAPEQIPNWPKMTVQETPVDEAPEHDPRYQLTVEVNSIYVRSYVNGGLNTLTSAELSSPDGTVLWKKKHVEYSQQEAGRAKELDEMEADGGKVFKEELAFAAAATAQRFIDHMLGKEPPADE